MLHRVGAVMLMGAVLGACGGSGGNGNNPVVTIAKTGGGSGDAQTAAVATALPTSLSVTVTEDGAAKVGATVTWSAVAGSGSVAPTSAVTNGSGVATTVWTLGTVAGAQTARATLSGAGGSPVSFTATGTAGAATAFTKNAGDGQTASPSAAFGTALSVKVADQFGNGIAGITVNWAVQSGSVTVASPTSITNASGVATKAATAGVGAGASVVRATNATVVGNLDFNLTVAQLPLARTVTIANNSFTSDANATVDPAVDTIGVGGTVSWNVAAGTHTVRGAPGFGDSGNLTSASATYVITFPAAGTFQYDCAIHGAAQMSGTVVVQ
ncbi:MAG: hypothetical protein ABI587_17155 [Gemmatimonadales bacterium]